MPIKVLKASAGSGKTFRLTNDYVDLLKKSPHNQILAVTFTNKATEEMKSRIVKELNDRVKENGDKAALEYLKSILHDYSHFNISTIDKFFQKIVRSMFRELGFSGLYNLVLDKTQLIEDSVDDMRMNLDKYKNAYQLLLKHALAKLMEGEDWSFSKQLKSLTQMLWKEEFMNLTPDELSLYTYDNVENLFNECVKKKEDILAEWAKLAKKAKESFEAANLELKKDSNRGVLTRLESFMIKKPNFFTETQQANLSFSGVFTKQNFSKYEAILRQTGFDKDIEAFADSYNANLSTYFSAIAITSHAIYLPVIVEINSLIRERLQDKNEFLLSEMNHLLAGMIGDNDAPFIYEKVGTQIQNYLLDEFQDTSSMQWKNFLPLVSNAVSDGNDNLVVGDVKQSIYRWRNSDWKILAHEIKDKYGDSCKDETLEDNWRSQEEIVKFNNGFFEKLVEGLQSAEIANVYSDVKQKINPKRKEEAQDGYVNVKVYKAPEDNKKKDFQETELEALYNDILQVRKAGYSYKDIGILTRNKNHGVLVSKYLLNKGINVISSESLLVSSSNDVRLLVYLLKMFVDNNDSMNNLILEKLRKSSSKGNSEGLNDSEKLEIKKASTLPLFEQVERYIQILNLAENKESIVYIQAFQDLVFNYNQKRSSDINGFLSWWELEGVGASIEGSAGVDAVNILTIHKSKGLDYPVVFVPFCEWPLGKSEIKWFKNTSSGFTTHLPLLPLTVKDELKKTCFSDEYEEEMLYRKIDNLNLLYVAFTRARHAMYIYSAPGQNHEVYKWVDAVMSKYSCSERIDEETVQYTFGKLKYVVEKKNEDKKAQTQSCECGYPSVYYRDDNSKVNLRFQTESTSMQREGNVLHGVLQYIKTKEDAPKAITRALRMGLISSDKVAEVKSELDEILNHPLSAQWYDGTYENVWNERTIIAEGLYRPDRIMEKDGELLVVDYKFGEQNDKYFAQIRNYIKLLTQMNKWTVVRGCLYYHKTKTLQWV